MATRAEIELAGTTLAERYDVLELLGAGGMGAVYRAHDRELDELVALKVIHESLARDPDIVARFRHEVKLARRVTHVNIARTFELGSHAGMLFCTMELIEGESLRTRLARRGKLPPAEASAIIVELCDGLAAAHAAGVVHRDIKPDNVLLANDGRVVLADFGVAAVTVGRGALDAVSGTPAYMAPEQARGEPTTPASDIYAVGLVLYEALTGERAFRGASTHVLAQKQLVTEVTLPADLPAELVQVVAKATAFELGDRIKSAHELRDLLAPCTDGDAHTGQVHRAAPAVDLATVVLFAPRAIADTPDIRMHIAEGIHEELLRRLVRLPRVRVLPRVAGAQVPEGATVVELHVGRELVLTICRDTVSTLHLPLEVAELEVAAEAAAAAIAQAVTPESRAPDEVIDLRLRARMLAKRSFAGVAESWELIERAHALAPDDPRTLATFALQSARLSVLAPGDHGERLEQAKELAAQALARASEFAEGHVAAGVLELNIGDTAMAARHFRRAIACAPYVAEAHDGLGRMLLEAGFLDDALARLEDALAISPNLAAARWEIARAWALEGRWEIHDAMITELLPTGDRLVQRMRSCWWRNDLTTIAAIRAPLEAMQRSFDPPLVKMMLAVILDGAWDEMRGPIARHLESQQSPVRRRNAFSSQLVAEAAAWSGDTDACLAQIERAINHGLFDLHWLDRAPTLETARTTTAFRHLHARVKRRADAILDALYGDHDPSALSDTVIG